jgi:hypothetical protein
MVRTIGERAHVRRAYIKKVSGVVRAVGEAAAEAPPPLDQHHLWRMASARKQVRRNDRSAKARADDGHAPARHRRSLGFMRRVIGSCPEGGILARPGRCAHPMPQIQSMRAFSKPSLT